MSHDVTCHESSLEEFSVLPQAFQLVHSILSFSTHVALRTEGNAVTSKNEISGTKPKIHNGIEKRKKR